MDQELKEELRGRDFTSQRQIQEKKVKYNGSVHRFLYFRIMKYTFL